MDTSDATTLVETAGEIMQSEIDKANETAAAVIEQAGTAIDIAQAQAQALAEAAMQTEIGRRVGALENRGMEWQGELDGLRRDLQSLLTQVAELQATISATATLTVATALQQPDPSLSIPPQSSNPQDLTETVAAVTEVVPGSLSEATPVETVPVPVPAKKHRFL